MRDTVIQSCSVSALCRHQHMFLYHYVLLGKWCALPLNSLPVDSQSQVTLRCCELTLISSFMLSSTCMVKLSIVKRAVLIRQICIFLTLQSIDSQSHGFINLQLKYNTPSTCPLLANLRSFLVGIKIRRVDFLIKTW